MLKKIIAAFLLVGVTGALIWGGVNRTQAKASSENSSLDGRQSQSHGNGDAGAESSGSVGSNGAGRWGSDTAGEAARDCDGTDGLNSGYSENAGNNQGRGYRGGNNTGGNNTGGKNTGGNQAGGGQGGGIEPLDELEIQALEMALDDEYHALSVYQSVIETFGPVAPFVEIAESEQRHIDALINQFEKHGIEVPENTWIGNVPTFDSVEAACQAGADAEIANFDLYQELLSMTDDPALIQVFTNLSQASQESHLPQFQSCQ